MVVKMVGAPLVEGGCYDIGATTVNTVKLHPADGANFTTDHLKKTPQM